MLAYVYDFLSVFFDKLKDLPRVRAVFLFGSVARGTARPDSDVDIFIDADSSSIADVQKIAREAVNEFELRAENTWKLRGVLHPIALIVGDLESEQWAELRKEIVSSGIALYQRIRGKEQRLQRKVLFSYDLSSLKQRQKMAFLRCLYGYILKKGKKVYRHEGLIPKNRMQKLPNALLADPELSETIKGIFKKHRVKFREF